ncbi:MAG: hypothetical protein Q8O67_11960 [Deltaproteobacteria bacterium]|nr:hypothetical protein [Deltaproteobacteria bacterium]
MRSLLVVTGVLVALSTGCDAGVDFAAVVDGHLFGRAGSLLTRSAQVIVDFSDDDVITLTAEARDGETVTDAADASCDRLVPEQGLFETRLPTENCVFVFSVTSTPDEELPETPTELVIGFRNADGDDGSVEIDPSLEEDLPDPFSFADSYARLNRVD